jgi:hypothetical protein
MAGFVIASTISRFPLVGTDRAVPEPSPARYVLDTELPGKEPNHFLLTPAALS